MYEKTAMTTWQSMRSVRPPWPGIESPKSFTRSARLKPEAKKPPKGAMMAANNCKAEGGLQCERLRCGVARAQRKKVRTHREGEGVQLQRHDGEALRQHRQHCVAHEARQRRKRLRGGQRAEGVGGLAVQPLQDGQVLARAHQPLVLRQVARKPQRREQCRHQRPQETCERTNTQRQRTLLTAYARNYQLRLRAHPPTSSWATA